MKCRMIDCAEYEPCIGFSEGYCTIYDIHVSSGDDCPIEDEYTENEEADNDKENTAGDS